MYSSPAAARMPFSMKKSATSVFDGYVLLNGAVIYFHDKIIYRAPLNKDFVCNICKTCENHHMEYTLQGERDAYVNKNSLI